MTAKLINSIDSLGNTLKEFAEELSSQNAKANAPSKGVASSVTVEIDYEQIQEAMYVAFKRVAEEGLLTPAKATRKRRTKAEIEAEKAEKEAAEKQVDIEEAVAEKVTNPLETAGNKEVEQVEVAQPTTEPFWYENMDAEGAFTVFSNLFGKGVLTELNIPQKLQDANLIDLNTQDVRSLAPDQLLLILRFIDQQVEGAELNGQTLKMADYL